MITKYLSVSKQGRSYIDFVIQYTWKEGIDPIRLLRPFIYSKFSIVELSFSSYFPFLGECHYFYSFQFGAFKFDVASRSLLYLSNWFTKLALTHLISTDVL